MSADSESPVSRVRAMGVRASSPTGLIALGFSRREADAVEGEQTARELLKRFLKIGRLADISPEEIREHTGFDDFEVLRAQALMELGRRSAVAGQGNLDEIDSDEAVFHLLSHLRGEKREHFCLVLLDAKNRVTKWNTIHIGTLTMSVVGPREVFRDAIREGASAVIVAHNHPSGDPSPSPEDIEVTNKLAEVGRMLDIPLLDHVIIGHKEWVSLRKRGIIR